MSACNAGDTLQVKREFAPEIFLKKLLRMPYFKEEAKFISERHGEIGLMYLRQVTVQPRSKN